MHDHRAHGFSFVRPVPSSSDLDVPGVSWACKNSIGGHRTVVRREPVSDGEPATKGQVCSRGMAGEFLELLAEVGLIEVARGLSELRPIDWIPGVDRKDHSRKAVDPRHSLRGDT